MSALQFPGSSVSAVETLMREKFQSEPFHNLHLLYGSHLQQVIPGGTCSDKTLSFVHAARKAGFEVALHSGFIGGKEIHRLARVEVNGRKYFADVGNGWPSLRLYPADHATSFRCFGMSFRTEVSGSRVSVFHEKQGKETLQLEIDVYGRSERAIRDDIASRFNTGIVYPFSTSVRFSLVVGTRFIFLRGEHLEIHSDSGVQIIDGISSSDIPAVIQHYFGYDIYPFLTSSSNTRPPSF